MDYRERVQLLRRLRDVIKENEKKIYEALYADLGKTKFEVYESELGPIFVELNYTIKYLSSWMKRKTVPTPYSHMPATSMVYREPYGKVLIISPWNAPFKMSILPLMHALAAGNQVILKPSEVCENSAKIIEEMLSKHFHTSIIRVLLGKKEVTMELLEQKFDFIFFTGSTRVGKIVMRKAAKQMIPVSLQLGGKSVCVIDRECNLKLASRRVIRGKFTNCGQSVLAPELVLLPETRIEEFISLLRQDIEKFYGKSPLESEDYGKIINLRQFYRLLDLLENQEILIGGDYDLERLKIEPTVVRETSFCSNLMKEEIFGPILPLISYRDWNEAMEYLSRFENPPAAYLFTKNKTREEFFCENVLAGSICINDVGMQGSTPYLPMGGVGSSGIGKYHGKAGFDLFSNIKSVMRKNSYTETRLFYPPFRGKLKWVKKVFK